MTKMLKTGTQVWALSNLGNVWGTFRSRKDAIADAEFEMQAPWSEIKSMEVRKVTIVEGWPNPRRQK